MDIRIAILTGDDFTVLGGAERHIMDTARALDADIICPHFDSEMTRQYDPNNTIRFLSFEKKLPKEPFKQLYGKWLFSRLDLDYDFYIAMDDMAVQYLKKGVPHLYYMFTPRRALYDMSFLFLDEHPLVVRSLYGLVFSLIRSYDRHFVKKYVNHLAGNSHNVRNRIYKVYQKDAEVLYPPIHFERYVYRPSEGYWLSVGRVDKWKRIELQVEAFRHMPDKDLIVAGPVYPKYRQFVSSAPPNVQFLGPIDEEQLISLYSRCEGLLATAIDEDFGLTPVEAMASGKPVVATKEGGYLESVVDGYTGILVAPTLPQVIHATNAISQNPEKFRFACQERAKMFDFSVYRKRLNDYIESISHYPEKILK